MLRAGRSASRKYQKWRARPTRSFDISGDDAALVDSSDIAEERIDADETRVRMEQSNGAFLCGTCLSMNAAQMVTHGCPSSVAGTKRAQQVICSSSKSYERERSMHSAVLFP